METHLFTKSADRKRMRIRLGYRLALVLFVSLRAHLIATGQQWSISVTRNACNEVRFRASGSDFIGEETYWQTSPNGTSTSRRASSSFTISGSGARTVYLRSQIIEAGESFGWYTRTSRTVTINGNTLNAGSISHNGGSKVCQGTDLTLSGSAAFGGTGSYGYQWMVSVNYPSQPFTPISGATSSSLTLDVDQYGPNAAYMRAVTSGPCGTKYSNLIATPQRYPSSQSLSAGSISGSRTICYNASSGTLSNSSSASWGSEPSSNISYQWYSSTDGGFVWNPISGATGASYNPGTLTQTTRYRRRARANPCIYEKFTSDVQITVRPELNGGDIGNNETICLGTSASILGIQGASGGTGSYTYQWEWAPTVGGGSWANITGATSQTYNPGNLTETRWFRRRVTSSGGCGIKYSDNIYVTVVPQISPGTVHYQSWGLCTGESFTLTGNSPTGGTGNYTYQWMVTVNYPSQPFIEIPDGTSASVEVNRDQYGPNATFVRHVSSANCGAYSNLLVTPNYPSNEVLDPGSIEGSKIIHFGKSAGTIGNKRSASWEGQPSSSITYQWEFSPNAAHWHEIVGATSATYEPGNLINTRWYRRRATASPCGYEKVTERVKVTVIFPPLHASQNYIQVDQPTVAVSSLDTLMNMSANEKLTNRTYFDGLGRDVQEVAQEVTPLRHDLVLTKDYDKYGRVVKEWLPYSIAQATAGSYVTPFNQENGLISQYPQEYDYAFAESIYEQGPLNRPVKNYAPGRGWSKEAGNHPISSDYLVNESDEVRLIKFDRLLSGTSQYYPAGKLSKRETIDEDGNTLIEFINHQGDLVLTKTRINAAEWADTYYIYDDFDSLRVVLPPEASQRLDHEFYANGANRASFLNRWAFLYEYNDRGQVTMNKVPGSDSVFTIYDRWARLVLTQDGNQKANNRWVYTSYDALNRPVMTGFITDSRDRQQLQTHILTLPDRYLTYTGSGTHGYSHSAYPLTSQSGGTRGDVLTVTYYDGYDFISDTDLAGTVFQPVFSTSGVDHILPVSNMSVAGHVTGTLTRGEGNDFLTTIIYYDRDFREIQVVSENHLSGVDVLSNQYDFRGKVRKTQMVYEVDGQMITIKHRHAYDHAERLIDTWHEIDDQGEILIAHNQYNALGELIEKDLHDPSNQSAGDFAQSIDYTYTIRGWLKQINDSQLSNTNEANRDLFGMELIYNPTPTLFPEN